MAGLKFSADIELDKIVKLRTEIKGLKADMMALAGKPNNGNAMKSLEKQLNKATKELDKYMKKYALMKKAYEEILKSDNTVKVVHEETQALQSTNKWIVANTQAVKEADTEIKKLKADFAALNDTEKVGDKGYNILRQVEQQVAIRKREEEAVRANIKAQKEQIIQNNSEEGSITQLRKQLSLMLNLYDNMGRIKRSGSSGKELLAQIRIVQAELNEAEQASGRFQRNVGNYSSAFNGLGMSIQQITRELPAATMGINMFFLAISNNLPIFFDEVQKARKEYAAYIEELKKGNTDVQKVAPVWKQIISGVVSWNTALVVGITLLTAYGKEIFNYIGGLISTKKATLDLLSAEQEMALARREAIKSSANERVKLDILYKATQDHTRSLKERNAAVEELQKMYPSYFGNLSNEAILAGKAKDIYAQLRGELTANAIARAQLNRMEDVANKREEALMKRRVQYNTYLQAQQKVDEASLVLENARLKARERGMTEGSLQEKVFLSKRTSDLNDAKEQAQKELDAWKSLIGEVNSYDKILEGMSKNIDIDALIKKIDGTGTKSGNDANAYADRLQRIKNLRDKERVERIKMEIELENQVEQARIDAMQDGYEKEQAQRKLNNKKELQAVDKYKQEYISKVVDIQRQIFEAEENAKASKDKSYKKRTFDASSVSVDTSIFGIINKAVIQKQANEIAGYYNEILSKYQDYATKRLNAAKQYQKDLEKLEKSGATRAQKDELVYQRDETLKSIDKEFAMREDAFQSWADSIATMSLRELQRLLTDAEKELERMEFLSPNSPKLAELRTKINTLNEQIGKSNNENTASPNKRSIKEWQDLYKTLQKVEHGFEDLGDAVGGVAGEILSTAGEIASSTLQMVDGIMTLVDNSSTAMKSVSEAASKSISTIEKASVILTIISSAIQLLQKISDLGSNKAFKQYEVYAEKVKEINALTEAVNEYRIATLEAQQAEENWFSIDNLKNLRDYKALHDEVAKAYADKATESQAVYQNQSGGGWLTGAVNWVMGNLSPLAILGDKWKNIWGQGDYDKGMTAAVNNLRIETRKASKGFLGTGIGGKSQKTEDLVTWARNQGLGELFDDEGLINKELAQSLIDNYGNKLVGQTKETLEALIELREQYDEYIKQLHEYVGSLYEPLVGNMVDSLWDWLDNGKDALDSFKDYASDTFRDIVSDMMRTIVLDKVVGSFDDDIAELYEKYAGGQLSEEELMRQVAERTGSLVDNYERNIPILESILSKVNGYFKEAGIDLAQPEDDTRTASQKGIATASQDSVDENNGRLAVMQGHTYSINENVSRMATGIDGLLNYSVANLSTTTDIDKTAKAIESQSKDILNHLANIDNYTSNLVEIREYMYAMKSGIDTLNIKGITLKR